MISPLVSRDHFPLFQRTVHGQRLAYLDNAATTQKPQRVLDAMWQYATHSMANVHRGVHTLADESTTAFEQAHAQIAAFFRVPSEQYISARNTTEAMHVLVEGWGRFHVGEGDVVAVTEIEHHSVFVAWQQLAKSVGAELVLLPVEESGRVNLQETRKLVHQLGSRLRVVALAHVSNALGVVQPVATILEMLEEEGVRRHTLVVLDAAQSVPHMPVHLPALGVDALVFSGHKVYGPMGSGGLVVTKKLLDELQPVYWGGGMIESVSEEETVPAENPIDRFSGGTPDVMSLVGLATTLEWLESLGWAAVQEHEHALLSELYTGLKQQSRVQLVGPELTDELTSRVGSVSWRYEGVHAHDVAQVLDRAGVAVRSGHHCTMPLHTNRDWIATTRASIAVYNGSDDIQALLEALRGVPRVFGLDA